MIVLVACAQQCCNGFFMRLPDCERIAEAADDEGTGEQW